MIGRMPCSITDAPHNDYSDYIEQTGVYKPYIEEDVEPDDAWVGSDEDK